MSAPFTRNASAVYSQQFFLSIQDSAMESAKRILPFVFNLVPHKSVVDIGCGTGIWLSVARQLGAERVLGFDGEYVSPSMLAIAQSEFEAVNLESPITCDAGPFDLAICLEVAEHLPTSAAEGLLNSLTSFAPAVLFSAAIPGQGGAHHVNEQWPDYWAGLFKARGFCCVDVVRNKFLNDSSVALWYAQNTLLYMREPSPALIPFVTERPRRLIHPRILAAMRASRVLALDRQPD